MSVQIFPNSDSVVAAARTCCPGPSVPAMASSATSSTLAGAIFRHALTPAALPAQNGEGGRGAKELEEHDKQVWNAKCGCEGFPLKKQEWVRDAKRNWSSTECNHVAIRFGAAAAHHKMPATRVRAQSKRCRPPPP